MIDFQTEYKDFYSLHKGVKKIDQCWSSKYTDYHFGIENFRSLHLCNMMKKQNDGYYEIFHEQNLCKLIYICIFLLFIILFFYRITGCFSTQDEI
jgi:hypothetical protein